MPVPIHTDNSDRTRSSLRVVTEHIRRDLATGSREQNSTTLGFQLSAFLMVSIYFRCPMSLEDAAPRMSRAL